MADLVRVAKALAADHGFRGYIHLKTIPGASEALIAEAGRYADRLSMNVELPNETSLKASRPEKERDADQAGHGDDASRIDDAERGAGAGTIAAAAPPRFAPAGQSTQMIVGADGADRSRDPRRQRVALCVLRLEARLLFGFQSDRPSLRAPADRRDAADARAPALPGRLAAAVLRLLAARTAMQRRPPACSISPSIRSLPGRWRTAACFRSTSTARRASVLLRVPGLGTRAVDRIIASRRTGALRLDDVARLAGAMSRARPFIVTADYQPGRTLDDARPARRG